jgi:hypothetical protein
MTDHSWFKLLVRAIGLLLIGIAVPSVLWFLAELLFMALPGSPGKTTGSMLYWVMSSLPALLGYGAQVAFGCYLLFRGDWIINRVLTEVRLRCLTCGYDLRGLKSTRCPECSTPLPHATGEARTRDQSLRGVHSARSRSGSSA